MNNLAINGGSPINKYLIKKPSPFGLAEKKAVEKVLDTGILSRAGRGDCVKKFEREYANFFGIKYAITTTSGTTALHTAICALGIKKDDEVIVPDLTFISTASVVLQELANPVFVDIDPKTFCMNPIDLKNKITPKTKAIIVVHMYGNPAEMNKIMDIAKKYKLFVIEDCAQAHGAKYKGRYVGTFGDISCFSFYQTKNLSCGEGGMVITRSKELYEKCNSVVDHGLINGNLQGYDYDRLGYNYHLSEIQAAIGLVQLHKLKRLNSERIQNANLYKKHLLNTGLVFQKDTAEAENVFYCLTALLPEKFKNKRDWFVDALRAENVEINKIYPVSLHQTKLFKRHSKNTYPISTDVTSRLFNFYTNPGISKKYIVNTCRAINKVLNYLENND